MSAVFLVLEVDAAIQSPSLLLVAGDRKEEDGRRRFSGFCCSRHRFRYG